MAFTSFLPLGIYIHSFCSVGNLGVSDMTKKEIKEVLDKHAKWLRCEAGGSRADLYRANLSGADLSGANLSGAKIEIELLNKFFPSCCPECGKKIDWKRIKDGDGNG